MKFSIALFETLTDRQKCCLKAIEQGGKTGDSYFRNQHGVLSVGHHVCMFVEDDTVKTKRFFVQQRKSYRSSRSNREFFTIFIEREICTSPFFK